MKKRRKLLAAAVLTAVAAAVYCNFVLDQEDWVVTSDRLPAAFDGTRVTLLTDLHGARFGVGHQTILEAVADSEPDLIAISGDLVDEVTDTASLEPLLRGLCAIAPVYYVPGNHEWGRTDTADLLAQFAEWGMTVLQNDYLLLEQDGETMVLAGTDDPFSNGDPDAPKQLMEQIRQEVPEDPFVLMLYHRNDSLALWSALEADLVLAGHGHGGVIRLPFVGGLLGVDRRFFPDDEEGLYTAGRTTLAVSRGLGGARLWNRPHLPTIVLKCAKNP